MPSPVIFVTREGAASFSGPAVVMLTEFRRRASISLHTPVAARYLSDLADDFTPPTPAAPPPMHV